jgi:hypothetical protein
MSTNTPQAEASGSFTQRLMPVSHVSMVQELPSLQSALVLHGVA